MFSDWKKRLADKRAASKMEVVPVPLDQLGGGWGMVPSQSTFGREDGKFFQFEGVMIHGAGREVADWGQPFLREKGTGVCVVVLDVSDNFIVTMREEPGNPRAKRCILLGPPLQTSLANLQQAHGGKRPPRAEFFDNKRVIWASAPKDGGRFIESMNRIGILRLPYLASLKLLPDEIILSRDELKEAFLAGELNPYMREAGMALL